MATGIATVHIIGLEGKTISINLPAATFSRTTISELKYQVELKMGVKIEIQRLVYGNKQLESQRDGLVCTFGDYSICNSSTIVLVIRLPGGGGTFIPLSFTDITSEDKFKPIDFDYTAPQWRMVGEGLNFEGTCKNETCKAKKKAVMVTKGFYDDANGQCFVNYEINQLKCPMCDTKLDKSNVSGVGIYRCKLEVKAKREHQEEISFNMESTDKFRFAQSLCEDDKINYEYIILLVKPL